MLKDENKIVMYILMRSDMESMTCGRSAAQASPAANDCVGFIRNEKLEYISLLEEWEEETEYFGTTIVLFVNEDEMNRIYNSFNPECGPVVVVGITHDPDYSVRDGETVHSVPVDTCMWIFGRRKDVRPYIAHLNLY